MSWGKSGRTWLRVMLSRFYQVAYGIPDGRMLEFDNLHRLDPRIPCLFFTHGNYLRDYTGNWTTKEEFYGKRILMLVRDPRDVAVSQYFQWKYRMRPVKKLLNDYPPHGAELSVFEFVMNAEAGLPKIIEFLEIWQRELPRVAGSLVVRYEDMRADPAAALRRVLAFLGTPGDRGADRGRGRLCLLRQHEAARAEEGVLAERDPARRRRSGQPAVLQGAARQGRRLARLLRRPARSRRSTPLLAARPMPPFGYGAAAPARQRA